MSLSARFGPLILLAGFLFYAAPVPAQTETASGGSDKAAQPEAPGTWTEPPVRGAAGAQPTDVKPSENAAVPDKTGPVPAKPVERASRPEKDAPVASEPQKAASTVRPVHRSAKFRREHIRVAARSRTLAETPLRRPRYGRVARIHERASPRREAHRRFSERRLYAYRAEPFRYARRDGMRDEAPMDSGAGLPPYGARRAGWGGLIADSRERRIAEARAAGYIVVRSRTYSYPDGTRVREMSPYSPYGLD